MICCPPSSTGQPLLLWGSFYSLDSIQRVSSLHARRFKKYMQKYDLKSICWKIMKLTLCIYKSASCWNQVRLGILDGKMLKVTFRNLLPKWLEIES